MRRRKNACSAPRCSANSRSTSDGFGSAAATVTHGIPSHLVYESLRAEMATIIFAAPPAGSDSARQRIHTLDPFEAVATVRQRIAGHRRPDVSVPVCLILWPQDKSPTEDLSDGFFQQIKPMSARLGCNPVDALKVWFNESIGIDATQQKAGHYGIKQLLD